MINKTLKMIFSFILAIIISLSGCSNKSINNEGGLPEKLGDLNLTPTSCFFIDLGPKTGYFPVVARVISMGYTAQDECSVKILFIGLT